MGTATSPDPRNRPSPEDVFELLSANIGNLAVFTEGETPTVDGVLVGVDLTKEKLWVAIKGSQPDVRKPQFYRFDPSNSDLESDQRFEMPENPDVFYNLSFGSDASGYVRIATKK